MKLLNIADIYNILSTKKIKDVFYFEGIPYFARGLRKHILNFPRVLFSMTGNVFEAINECADENAVRLELAEHKMSLYAIYIKGEPNTTKYWADNGKTYTMNFDIDGYCPVYVGQTAADISDRLAKHLSYAKNFGKSQQSKSPLPRFLHWIDRDKIEYADFSGSDYTEKDLYEMLSLESDLLNSTKNLSTTPFVTPTKCSMTS
jgi:hypothetical protein